MSMNFFASSCAGSAAWLARSLMVRRNTRHLSRCSSFFTHSRPRLNSSSVTEMKKRLMNALEAGSRSGASAQIVCAALRKASCISSNLAHQSAMFLLLWSTYTGPGPLSAAPWSHSLMSAAGSEGAGYTLVSRRKHASSSAWQSAAIAARSCSKTSCGILAGNGRKPYFWQPRNT